MPQPQSQTDETLRILLIVVIAALLVLLLNRSLSSRFHFRKNRVVFGNFQIGNTNTINTGG